MIRLRCRARAHTSSWGPGAYVCSYLTEMLVRLMIGTALVQQAAEPTCLLPRVRRRPVFIRSATGTPAQVLMLGSVGLRPTRS